MAEGFRSLFVSGVVVLAAPLAVTAFAVAGVTPGDALRAIGVGSAAPDERYSPASEAPMTADRSRRSDDAPGAGSERTGAAKPAGADAEDRAREPGAADPPEQAPTPDQPAAPEAETPPAAEPEAPAAPGDEPARGPIDDVNDVLDDPVGATDDLLGDRLGDLLP